MAPNGIIPAIAYTQYLYIGLNLHAGLNQCKNVINSPFPLKNAVFSLKTHVFHAKKPGINPSGAIAIL
jgi:hypothetical protein